MARKSQHTFSKRQREQKKSQKAAEKRARREERLNPTAPPEDAEVAEHDAPVEQDEVSASE